MHNACYSVHIVTTNSLGGVSRHGPAAASRPRRRRRPHGGHNFSHHVGLLLLLLGQILVAAPEAAGLGEGQLGDGVAGAGRGGVPAAVLEQEAAAGKKQDGNRTVYLREPRSEWSQLTVLESTGNYL